MTVIQLPKGMSKIKKSAAQIRGETMPSYWEVKIEVTGFVEVRVLQTTARGAGLTGRARLRQYPPRLEYAELKPIKVLNVKKHSCQRLIIPGRFDDPD